MSEGEKSGETLTLQAAQERFQIVLQNLEANLRVVSERAKTVKSIEDRALQLTNERTQMVAQIANMTQRLNGLETANQNVSERLSQAVETVRSVLQEGGE